MGGCALITPVYLEIALMSGARSGAIKARCKLHRAKNGQTKTTVRVHRGLVIVVKVIVNILGIFTEGIIIPVFIKAFVHDQIVKRFKQLVDIVNIQRNFRQFSFKEFSGVVTHFYQFDHLVS